MKADSTAKNIGLPAPLRPIYGLNLDDKQYYCISILLIVGTLAVNRFLLSPTWATSEAGKQLVEFILPFYPGLRELKNNWGGYTPQLGVLFSSMFASMPIHFLLGLRGSFALNEENRTKVVRDTTWKKFLIPCGIFFVGMLMPFFSTHVNGYGRRMPFTNQASDSFVILSCTWILFFSLPYCNGFHLGLIIQKIKYAKKSNCKA